MWVGTGAVGERIDVAPAREQQPVEAVEQFARMFGRRVVRRHEQRDSTRRLDGVCVATRQQSGRLVPSSEAGVLDSRADPDGRTGHCGVT